MDGASTGHRNNSPESTESVALQALFAELEKAPPTSDGALTTREIVDLTGKSFYAVDNLIREACRKGLMRPVRVRREARDLTIRTTTGYMMVQA